MTLTRKVDPFTESLKPLPPLAIKDAPALPFLRWAGGKDQLLAELRARVPKVFGRYYEPFLGGGSLFFDLAGSSRFARFEDPTVSERRTWADVNDSNRWLTATYAALREMPDQVIRRLYELQALYRGPQGGEKFYYEVRNWGVPAKPAGKAAVFIFLNKTNYNGLWRVNRKGGYNVPHGKRNQRKDGTESVVMICDEDNLRRVSKMLQSVTITSTDFEAAVKGAARGDFVYFDPPYVPVSASSDFTAYTKEPFGPAEQVRLRDCALALKSRGVKVMLSNADVPYVHKLYGATSVRACFKIERVEARRSINSKAAKRGNVGELIIT